MLEKVINKTNFTCDNVKIPFIHIDGTYTLLLNRFIVVFGTKDINHHFHSISVTVAGHWNKETYIAVLIDLEKALKDHYNLSLFPKRKGSPNQLCIDLLP